MEEIKFMNTKQVAQALGCSMPTARQIMMRADFPLIRVGKNYKVSEQAFKIAAGYSSRDIKKEEFNDLK